MFETKSRTSRIILQTVTTILVIPFVLPLVAMVRGSLSGAGVENYKAVLAIPALPLFFRNSLIIAASVVVIVCVCTMLAAYGFAKLRIHGKEVMFYLLLAALTLPEVVLLTPLFATATKVGLYDTYLAVIIPLSALQIPFAVLLARNFVEGIPNQLLEAARIDGAGTGRVFYSIVLPLSRPILGAIVVLTLIAAWNDYLLPLVFLQNPDLQTVTLVPQFFVSQFDNDQTKVLAAAVITAVPTVVTYLLMQRFFERGLSAGALK